MLSAFKANMRSIYYPSKKQRYKNAYCFKKPAEAASVHRLAAEAEQPAVYIYYRDRNDGLCNQGWAQGRKRHGQALSPTHIVARDVTSEVPDKRVNVKTTVFKAVCISAIHLPRRDYKCIQTHLK